MPVYCLFTSDGKSPGAAGVFYEWDVNDDGIITFDEVCKVLSSRCNVFSSLLFCDYLSYVYFCLGCVIR
jgi:hypothetical protein